MKRARIAALMSATLLIGFVVVPATSAGAVTGSCSVSATLPSRVRIVSDNMSIPVALGASASNCVEWASYDLVRSDGAWTYGLMWSAPGVQDASLFSQDGPGRYKATNGDGYDTLGNAISAPDSNWMTAKFNSHAQWKGAKRSGKTVTLSAAFKRYSYTGGQWGMPGYTVWNGANVRFQEKVGRVWRTVKTVHANRRGIAQVRITASRHIWRAVAAETGSIWSVGTGGHRK